MGGTHEIAPPGGVDVNRPFRQELQLADLRLASSADESESDQAGGK